VTEAVTAPSSGSERGSSPRWHSPLTLVLLAALAYLPALASSPGRMPADTKLYLYLDPAGLIGRAASTFEPDQFAGWVPHQQITYLWPSGPWFLLFDALAVPDWIAHRLWIGTILFAAGAGAWWAARRLGLGVAGALVAALVYELSPYLLPYVSRTSLLLLPWAALGWLVGLTTLACDDIAAAATSGSGRGRTSGRLRVWRAPALIALVVATVGSANATALLLVAPGPALWLLHAARNRAISWRQCVAVAARVGVLCVGVSLWWVAMLVVQSRAGAPVLSYSETLEDVSRNATGSEVLRGLGYWLFYIRDPFAPTTTASGDYLASARGIAISYAVVLVGLIGLVAVKWRARSFAALLALVGVVLAVGVHPIDDPSPMMKLVADDDGSGIALALRSSTRATPLLVLALALGAGALVAAVPEWRADLGARRWRARALAATIVAGLAIVNLPALWGFDLVDPAIDRDQDPPDAWIDAAEAIGDDTGFRVLQLPGAEFGAFRWGYTVDQPLVALTDRPLVTRDLLPLGSGPAMDLLYALDDRVQEGRLEASTLAPLSRYLGVDTVWLANDIEFERFRSARPEVLRSAIAAAEETGDLAQALAFGVPAANVPTVAMIDPTALANPEVGRALPPVEIVTVVDPVPTTRAKPTSVLLSGSGDGIVDAAAAGLLTGREAVRYSASLDGEELRAAAVDATAVVVTDSNRDRAHHWRGSQDVHGHTEPGGPDDDVLTTTAADQRLEVFDQAATEDPRRQTIAVQDGPVRAIATAYGEPFAYRPERRAVMAIDGDPTTAWLVGDHGDPIGERIELVIGSELDRSVETLTLRQPAPAPGGRSIAAVAVSVGESDPIEVSLPAESFSPEGWSFDIPTATPGDSISVEITELVQGDPAVAASRAGVGFVEIATGLEPTVEYVRPPIDAVAVAEGRPLAIVLTRLRVDPTDPWRSDPEPELQRLIEVPDTRAMTIETSARLDVRTSDATLAGLVDQAPRATASARLTGSPRHAGMFAVDGDPSTAWITPFDGALGAALRIPLDGAPGGELLITQPAGPFSTLSEITIAQAGRSVTAPVPQPDVDGRSVVAVPEGFDSGELELTISGIEPATTVDRRYGDTITLPVAVAEVSGAGIPTRPLDGTAVVDTGCRADLLVVDGRPVPVRITATVDALLDGDELVAAPCEGPVELSAGEHLLRSSARHAGLSIDRVTLSDVGPPVEAPLVDVELTRDDPRARDLTVAACPDGCWLVFGEGFNTAWEATADGERLGDPQLIDGGFNGWWLAPGDGPTDVQIRWTAQRPVTIGLWVSALTALGCIVLVALTIGLPRRRVQPDRPRPLAGADRRPAYSLAGAAGFVVASALLIAPVWGVAAALVLVVDALFRRLGRRVPAMLAANPAGWIGVAAAAAIALLVVGIERADAPVPNAGWTESFDRLNGLAVFAVLCIAVGALRATSARRGEAH
jgi:arabinofuranan 3-O-arabinosyltransferase